MASGAYIATDTDTDTPLTSDDERGSVLGRDELPAPFPGDVLEDLGPSAGVEGIERSEFLPNPDQSFFFRDHSLILVVRPRLS